MYVRPGVYLDETQVVGVVENPHPGVPLAAGQDRSVTVLVGRSGTPIGVTLKTNKEGEGAEIAKALGLDGPRRDPGGL